MKRGRLFTHHVSRFTFWEHYPDSATCCGGFVAWTVGADRVSSPAKDANKLALPYIYVTKMTQEAKE